jgi:CopA family copper-resistance protein
MDRSGMGRATLAPRMGMSAAVPPLRARPILTMRDMGMGDMNHGAAASTAAPVAGAAVGDMAGMDHSSMPSMSSSGSAPTSSSMAGMDHASTPTGEAGAGGAPMYSRSNPPPGVRTGVGVDNIAAMPVDRTGDPGIGLEDAGHRVLTYRDLMALTPGVDRRAPARTVEIHLTGNMERFMWSFDGVRMSEGAEPIRFERNERVRLKLVNDSMMAHPIHLHGHFFEVVNGHTGAHPLKHTVNVLPGGFVRLDLTADAPGDWAFHCHLLYHMHAGMMRVVTIRPLEGGQA